MYIGLNILDIILEPKYRLLRNENINISFHIDNILQYQNSKMPTSVDLEYLTERMRFKA